MTTHLTNRSWLLMATLIAIPFLGGARECEPTEPSTPCACPRIYAPVCGDDGTTYGNACEASCVGVDLAHEGECRDEPVLCTEDSECDGGEVCSLADASGDEYCFGPPCEDGMACPDVCYGRCEEPPHPTPCGDDADCAPHEECVFDSEPMPLEDRTPEEGWTSEEDCGPETDCVDASPPLGGLCTPRPDSRLCGDDGDCPPDAFCSFEAEADEHEGVSTTAAYGYCEPLIECLPVTCALYCEDGFTSDEHGCPTCACADPAPEPPVVCPAIACADPEDACEYGFRTDEHGCPTCECADPAPPHPVEPH